MKSGHIRALATAACIVLASGIAGSPAGATPTGERSRGYFVDCSGGADSAMGTQERPWKTLARVNSAVFRPGDQLLFRRGTRCDGTLAPQGSGTKSSPIRVGAYGRGAKPQIVGGGGLTAVLLHNVQGWELRDLDLSNRGTAPGEHELRFGVYVLLEDFGVGRHYVLENLNVHDVNGCDCQNPHDPIPTGGIIFKAGGSTTPTGFDGITVQRNTLTRVDRAGISTSSDWERRPEYPTGKGNTFVPITGLRILDNFLTDIGGDGIGVYNGLGARVERNILRDYAVRSPTKFSIGITPYNADGTAFRYNEVSGGHGTGQLPSQSFMIETAVFDTVFEYNLSRDSGGGLIIACVDADARSDRNVVRYNISQNDDSQGYYFSEDFKPGVFTILCGDPGRVDVYGNTIYTSVAERMVVNLSPGGFHFTNNIIVGRGAGSTITDATSVYDHNLYQSVTAPAGDANATFGDPMLVAPGTATSRADANGYRLRSGSPALQAGITMAGNARHDYFGNPVPSCSPNIGAYAGAGVGPAGGV